MRLMGRIIVAGWVILLVVGATAGAVVADTPTPAELFEAVRQQEAWFTTLPRCWIRIETGVATARGDLSLLERNVVAQDQVGLVLPASAFRRGGNVCQLLWDENHVAVHSGPLPFMRAEIHDGRRSVQVHSNGKWVIRSADAMPDPMENISWPHLSSMRQWFVPEPHNRIDPRGASVAGIERYRGRDCYVLLSLMPRRTRWFIGVEDHRLYGYQSGRTLPLDELDEFTRHAATEQGVMVSDYRALDALQDEQVKQKVHRTLNQMIGDAGRPQHEIWFDDYRKVPGTDGIYPFDQGFRTYGVSKTPSGVQQANLTEGLIHVAVFDTSYIPTALFNTQPPVGTDVTDQTRLVTGGSGMLRPMQYTQPTPSPWRNPANWPSLLKASISTSGLIAFAALGLAAGLLAWTVWQFLRVRRRIRRLPPEGPEPPETAPPPAASSSPPRPQPPMSRSEP